MGFNSGFKGLIKQAQPFIETDGSFSCSQKPATGPVLSYVNCKVML